MNDDEYEQEGGTEMNEETTGEETTGEETTGAVDHGMLGGMLEQVMGDHGMDAGEVAEKTGASTSDLSSMNPAEMMAVVQHLAQEHPEVLAMVGERFPAAQGILGMLGAGGAAGGAGGMMGMLGGLLKGRE